MNSSTRKMPELRRECLTLLGERKRRRDEGRAVVALFKPGDDLERIAEAAGGRPVVLLPRLEAEVAPLATQLARC